MTFRLPLPAGSKTRSCSSVESPACSAKGVSFVAVRGSLQKKELESYRHELGNHLRRQQVCKFLEAILDLLTTSEEDQDISRTRLIAIFSERA